jgi:site-specific DNA-methyltransferase (adenine-specific)
LECAASLVHPGETLPTNFEQTARRIKALVLLKKIGFCLTKREGVMEQKIPEIRLYLGDCVKGMRKHMDPASIDICVTSPPYNLGIRYRSYSDDRALSEYLDWTDSWISEVRKVLKEDGSLFLNIAGSLKLPLLPHLLIDRVVNHRKLFRLQNTIHWIKSIAIPDKGSARQIGHYKPITSQRFINDCHEYVFHLTPTGNTRLDRKAVGVPYADKSNIARWSHSNGSDVKCKGNTWFIPYKTIVNRAKNRPHPATFPTELALQCIRLHGRNGSSRVLDPFLGIGHAALAATESRVAQFVGFEIDSEYMRVAGEELRVRGVTPQIAAA